jgi:hypothetical protein
MGLHQRAESLVGVPGKQRSDSWIERDEADLEVIVSDPERQVVLTQRSVSQWYRPGAVTGLSLGRRGAAEQGENRCQVP